MNTLFQIEAQPGILVQNYYQTPECKLNSNSTIRDVSHSLLVKGLNIMWQFLFGKF